MRQISKTHKHVKYAYERLEAGDSVSLTGGNTTNIINRIKARGMLVSVEDRNGYCVLTKRDPTKDEIEIKDMEDWEVQKYCISQGLRIYPVAINKSQYVLEVEDNGNITREFTVYKHKPVYSKDVIWWKDIMQLYKDKYLLIKNRNNE